MKVVPFAPLKKELWGLLMIEGTLLVDTESASDATDSRCWVFPAKRRGTEEIF